MKFAGSLVLASLVLLMPNLGAGKATADTQDVLTALAALGIVGIIANDIKNTREVREAEESAATSKEVQQVVTTPICKTPNWDGERWREPDGTACLVTPEICMKEGRQSNRNFVYFDADCMWQEGFRLTSRF